MGDLKKTQHFSSNYEKLLKNIEFYPEEAIDPFAGAKDLLQYSKDTKWTFYDIEPIHEDIIKNDSLLNPPDYTDKTVITNPPYLAQNKTKEFKEIFDKYKVDDLYKAAILSIIGCKNGILIIPINFFTDEVTSNIRKEFLSKYKVKYVNVFSEQMFENTTYNVCSFYFELGKTDVVEFYNVSTDTRLNTVLDEKYGYRLGGEFYNIFKNAPKLFSRVRTGKENNITNIFLQGLDDRKNLISLYYNTETYIGKNTDRVFATLYCKQKLDENIQKQIIEEFNLFLNSNRKKYNNLILTNYRDFGRKRISFDDAYKICSMILLKLIKNSE